MRTISIMANQNFRIVIPHFCQVTGASSSYSPENTKTKQQKKTHQCDITQKRRRKGSEEERKKNVVKKEHEILAA